MKTYEDPKLCRDQREFKKRPMVIIPTLDAVSMINKPFKFNYGLAHEKTTGHKVKGRWV